MVAIRICPEGNIIPTDLYKYSMPDAAPPIHAVATDKGPSIDGGKFKFRKTDGRRIGIRFPVFILTYVYSSACHFTSVFQIITKLAAAIFGGALYGGGVLPAQYYPCDHMLILSFSLVKIFCKFFVSSS